MRDLEYPRKAWKENRGGIQGGREVKMTSILGQDRKREVKLRRERYVGGRRESLGRNFSAPNLEEKWPPL